MNKITKDKLVNGKLTRKQQMRIYSFIYDYPTKHKMGFIEPEIEHVLSKFPDINMQKYNDAMMGNTCGMDKEDGLIIYHCDLLSAIHCGVEVRDLRFSEWD